LLIPEKLTSLLLRIRQHQVWNACARGAYGISRLSWSNLPAANRRRRTSLVQLVTTELLPTPE